jgi:hypothetical protein
VVGSNSRGPFRWYQSTEGQNEIEIPHIKSIEIDRSVEQDVASCNITIYNTWMFSEADVRDRLGTPGFFWPKHGSNPDAISRWEEVINDWDGVIEPYGLLRTYEGWGGWDELNPQVPLPIENCLQTGSLTMTGVWLIDKVVGGTNGLLTLQCRDIGKILLEQMIYPPLVPSGLYPLEYYPPDVTPYTVEFGPQSSAADRQIGARNIALTYSTGSSDEVLGSPGANLAVHNHYPTDALDGNDSTYALSNGLGTPSGSVYWDFNVPGSPVINEITINPFRGPYQVYICLLENGQWQNSGGGNAPGQSVPFVTQVGVNSELPTVVKLNRRYSPNLIRLVFTQLWQSQDGPDYFRAGLREIRAGFETTNTEGENAFPHALAIARATNGYWITDSSGNTYAFGDAQIKPENATSRRSSALYGTGQVKAMASNGTRNGYWIMNINGAVRAYGDAQFYGDLITNNPNGQLLTDIAVAFAPTHTGNGYWIFLQNGVVYNFGDAPSFNTGNPNLNLIPKTPLLVQREQAGIIEENTRTITAAVASPGAMGYWAINENGEVSARGGVPSYGEVHDRLGPLGPMQQLEFVSAIETTKSGMGYWMISGTGIVWQFGDAPDLGSHVIYPTASSIANIDIFFEALVRGLIRNDEGGGFYILRTNGSVEAVNTPVYGGIGDAINQPYPGNVPDYSTIITDLLLWSGWYLYDPNASDPTPGVYGTIETTGIAPQERIGSETFDKKTIFDCINTVKEIVAYMAFVDQDGGFQFRSPNFWKPGNFVDGDYVSYIPEIDERSILTDYSVTLDGDALRSQIIISSELPDVNDSSVTSYVNYVPETADQLHGVIKPAIWVNDAFSDPTEQEIMAELIALQIWFTQRTGNIACVANPCLSINDQVRIYERNTSETYIHYIRSISTSHDLDTGVYTAQLQTNWLGDGTDWAITDQPVLPGEEKFRVTTTYAQNQLSGIENPPPPTDPGEPPPSGTLLIDEGFVDLNNWIDYNDIHIGGSDGDR